MIDLNRYIGKAYWPGGVGPDEYDCYGLVIAIAAERGYELPDQQTAESVAMRHAMFARESSRWLRPVDQPRAWDLVVFDHRSLGLHVGTMIAEPGRFIHVAEMPGSVCLGRLSAPIFHGSIHGFFRLDNPIHRPSEAS